MVLVAFHPGFLIKFWQMTIHSDLLQLKQLNSMEILIIISFSKWSNVTGQLDRQDERLTGQLPNRFIHCPLTGRYFEPCFWINLFVCDWLQSSDSAVIVKKNKGLIAWLKTCHNQWIGNSWMKVLNHLVSNIVNEKFASSYCNVNLGK